MAVIEKDIAVLLDSQYGTNVSALGSQFTVNLSPPIQVPSNAVSCIVEATEAAAFYTMPNLADSDLTWSITSDASGGEIEYDSSMSSGLYEVASIVQSMNEQASAAGVSYTHDLWTYTTNTATQKVALGAWIASSGNLVGLDLTDSSMGWLLGYDSSSYVFGSTAADVSGAYYFIEAGSSANFGTLSYLQIKTSLPCRSIGPDGNSSATVITLTPNDTSPGEQIVATPQHPLRCDADQLIGSTINQLVVRLLDDDNNEVDTTGESWSCRLRIRYWIRV